MLGLQIYLALMLMKQAFPFKMLYEASYESWHSNGSSVWDFKVRLLGREHRLNGTIEIKEDIDDDHHSVDIETYNDAFGNGEFKKTAIYVAHQSVCHAIANFWFYLRASMPYGEKTNLPFESHTCPIPKGHYYVKDVTINPERWPMVMPRGYFKYVLNLKKDTTVVSQLVVVIHVVDRTS